MNDREANLLVLQTSSQNRHVVMWGSVLGGLIGAVIGALAGGAVTYYRERRLESRRKHEETVQELVYDTVELCNLINDITKDMKEDTNDVYPSDVHRKARNIVLKTNNLDDEELQRRVVKVLNKNYDDPRGVFYGVYNLNRELRMRAYPVVQEVEAEVRMKDAEGKAAQMIGNTDAWPGPANIHFKNKLVAEGAPVK